jgi:uncharacterized membrane protein YkoI
MKLTSQISWSLRILLLAAVASCAAHSNANPLGNLTGGRINMPERRAPEQRLDTRSKLSVNEAISIAEQRYGGRAVGAKKISSGNGSAYSVRILQDNGKIKNVIIND